MTTLEAAQRLVNALDTPLHVYGLHLRALHHKPVPSADYDDALALVNQSVLEIAQVAHDWSKEHPVRSLTDHERYFLTLALDLAAERMLYDDGFTEDDEAALAGLRTFAKADH